MSQANIHPVLPASVQTPATGKKAFFIDSSDGKARLMDENRDVESFAATLLNGNGNPANSVGFDGDYYINTATNFIFGPKASGSWPSGISLTGPQGIQGNDGQQGIQGIQGNDGPQGPAGASGPMNVEAFINYTSNVTLPNTTSKQTVYSESVTIGTTGDCFLDVSLASKPFNTGDDMEFDIVFDGAVLDPDYAEEHKDTSTAQSVWRSQCFSLGNVAAGTYTLALRFSKEDTGGTATLKNYTAKLVRYS